jgi:hypothetical protein
MASILCPKPTLAKWQSRLCLMGDYKNYGVHTLKLCPFELEITTIIHWQKIRYEVVG